MGGYDGIVTKPGAVVSVGTDTYQTVVQELWQNGVLVGTRTTFFKNGKVTSSSTWRIPPPPITEPPKSDISANQGAKITAEARTWKGTPYKSIGQASEKGVGGDCSGITWSSYRAAGFAYKYKETALFLDYVKRTNQFREVAPNEKKQEGDILYWPNHMAIYSTFANDPADATTLRHNAMKQPWTQKNDMWTATNPNGPAFEPAAMFWFKHGEPPRVFRYQR
jgi:hypothetical protein